MLQFLRNNTKIFAWLFVAVLIAAFGLSSFTFNKHDQYAGEAFGKKVSFQEFRVFETMTRLLPSDPRILEDAQTAYAYAWQQLILAREAQNQKIEVTDDEVRLQVDQIMNRGGNARISPDEYASLLKSWRTTPNEFERGVREMIRISKMLSAKFKTAQSPAVPAAGDSAQEKELAAKAQEEQEKLKTEYIRWLTELNVNSKMVDYSKLKQTAPAQEDQA